MDKVFFNGTELQAPYKCDPTDNTLKCRYQYNTTKFNGIDAAETDYFERPCQCAMDEDNGFCESILGTSSFETGAQAIKELFSDNQCHTLDRGDYRAMQEDCGPNDVEQWQNAAEWNFKINNWPNVNAENQAVRDCFYRMDKNSP